MTKGKARLAMHHPRQDPSGHRHLSHEVWHPADFAGGYRVRQHQLPRLQGHRVRRRRPQAARRRPGAHEQDNGAEEPWAGRLWREHRGGVPPLVQCDGRVRDPVAGARVRPGECAHTVCGDAAAVGAGDQGAERERHAAGEQAVAAGRAGVRGADALPGQRGLPNRLHVQAADHAQY